MKKISYLVAFALLLVTGACGVDPDSYDSTKLGKNSPLITVNPQVRCKLPDSTVVNIPARDCKAGKGVLTDEETAEGKATKANIDAIETKCLLPESKVVDTTIKGCREAKGSIISNCTGLCAEWMLKSKLDALEREVRYSRYRR